MRLHIWHETRYRYSGPVSYSIQLLRLTPREDGLQRSLQWEIRAPGRLMPQRDAFGNLAHLLAVEARHQSLTVSVRGIVETLEGADRRLADSGPLTPQVYLLPTTLTQPVPAISALSARLFGAAAAAASEQRLLDLMQEVRRLVRYQPGSTAASDPAAVAIERGVGVCQDQAHVALAVCRAAGIPARYVSGYLLDEPGAAANAASHAWIEVWLAGQQAWLGCDVTHGSFAGANLCRLAAGRDYLDAAPVRGVRRGGGAEQLAVSVSVSAVPQQ